MNKELVKIIFNLGYQVGRDAEREFTKNYDELNRKYHNLLEWEAEKITDFLDNLKIEERELSLEERNDYYTSNYLGLDCETHEELDKLGDIPTKLITITYKDKTIESYE